MTSATPIKLATSDDWIPWFSALKTKALNQDLWEYIDPAKTNKPTLSLKKPIPPDIATFRRRKGAATAANTEASTPGSADTGTIIAASGTQADSEDPRLAFGEDSALQASEVTDLTDKGLQTYNAMWANYEYRTRQYKATKKSLDTVQDWIKESISVPLYRQNCTAETSLADWVESLQNKFAQAQDERIHKARRTFRELLAKPHQHRITTYKGTEEWLALWEDAVQEAQAVKLQEATEASQWFKDLVRALRGTPLESWINAYDATKTDEAISNTLPLTRVTGAIRRAIDDSPETPRRGKVAPGAFHTHQGQASEPSARDRRKRPRPHSATNSVDIKCPACLSTRHPLAKCYYAFPKLRPEGWRLNAAAEALVKERIEKNVNEVADRIKKLTLSDSQ
ncbi:hypothetical protein B0J13DRAFT_665042 [Dactylonectria estremocensis]|uniref:Gag protein n=1 Tax=Dactylonectria estremocensis TaxID=1079267 RepID=A0A9P9EYS1_9HYPO|nr:hypothetical protein B0J13DRAFT_665042 [Dactylonectria estremocensis]